MGDVADFVEEQRPGVRRFDEPLLVAYGMGERPLDMAKEFTFQKPGGCGSAIDHDKRFFSAVAQLVNPVGDALLAHPAFSENQYIDAASGYSSNQAMQVLHGRTFYLVVGIRFRDWIDGLGRVRVLAFQQHQLDFFGQGLAVKRLFDVVHSAGFDGFYRIGHIGVGGQKDNRKARLNLDDFRQQCHAVHLGHFDIRHHEVDSAGLEDLKRLAPAIRLVNGEPAAGKPGIQNFQYISVVVYNEDRL